MRVKILGQERRRRWGDEKKVDIVMLAVRRALPCSQPARLGPRRENRPSRHYRRS
ncbi:hypothetical protein GOA75_29455 [Sinorhizobium meliloti]|nr:hypothetical protein [Sinorhizobium meliloti]